MSLTVEQIRTVLKSAGFAVGTSAAPSSDEMASFRYILEYKHNVGEPELSNAHLHPEHCLPEHLKDLIAPKVEEKKADPVGVDTAAVLGNAPEVEAGATKPATPAKPAAVPAADAEVVKAEVKAPVAPAAPVTPAAAPVAAKPVAPAATAPVTAKPVAPAAPKTDAK